MSSIGVIAANTARSKASRYRCSTPATKSRSARRLPEGVVMFTGDDFNYRRSDRGRRRRPQPRAAGHLRSDRARRGRSRCSSWTRGDIAGFRPILDPTVPLSRAAFSRRRPGTTSRSGVPRLAEWLPGSVHHDRQSSGRSQRLSLCRRLPPRRSMRAVAGARARGDAHAGISGAGIGGLITGEHAH